MIDEMLKNLFIAEAAYNDGRSAYSQSNIDLTPAEHNSLPSVFPVSELAVSSIYTAALALRRFAEVRGLTPGVMQINPALCGLWFGNSARPISWQAPPLWDSIAGDYACADGWVRLHTNYEHHRRAALNVLECDGNRPDVVDAVARWPSDDLEQAIVSTGGCAAAMRTMDEWDLQAQGKAVSREPLIRWTLRNRMDNAGSRQQHRSPDRSNVLAGIKVLDCTRVLAGPAATRLLAGFGADVLRIDPPHWEEGAINLDMTLGKRRGGLDLTTADGCAVFRKLLKEADVFVHGLRPDALELLGLGESVRQEVNPDLIDVALNAYGWSGPWSSRRGFDSLVQMSCGIADLGMTVAASDKPQPLPVQALDHATGYLMAASVLAALAQREEHGLICTARLSLARTARLLTDNALQRFSGSLDTAAFDQMMPTIEDTVWGRVERLPFPISFDNFHAEWPHAAGELRVHPPAW